MPNKESKRRGLEEAYIEHSGLCEYVITTIYLIQNKLLHVWIALLPNFHLKGGTFTVSMWPEHTPEVV